MSKIKHGGPAFPVECSHVDGELSGRQTGNYTSWHMGMTLLDHFATGAVQGLLAAGMYDTKGAARCALEAYEIAGAMIAARPA